MRLARSSRFPRGRLTGAAVLAAAISLAACGGDSDADGNDASFDAGPVKITKPGTTLATGERAVIDYEGQDPNLEAGATTTLGVTVLDVREGDASDIDGLTDQEVPYYVDLELESHGEEAITPGPVGNFLEIRGSDGKAYDVQGVVSIGGEFEPCEGVDSTAALDPQQAILDCEVVVLAEEASPVSVEFPAAIGLLGTTEKPITWEIE